MEEGDVSSIVISLYASSLIRKQLVCFLHILGLLLNDLEYGVQTLHGLVVLGVEPLGHAKLIVGLCTVIRNSTAPAYHMSGPVKFPSLLQVIMVTSYIFCSKAAFLALQGSLLHPQNVADLLKKLCLSAITGVFKAS